MASPNPLPAALVEEELRRLIDSDALRRAPSHTRLLRYLVERRVAGDETAFRETSIALEVFRRDPATYDPQADPIVRVTTGRLRARLEAHYARYDHPPRLLRIVLPKGRYEPEFVAIERAADPPLGLAVLGTRNNTGDDELAGRCLAFAQHLSDQLARAGLPRVLARGTVDTAEALTRDPAALGARLQVPWLLDSTLSREQGQELRLSLRLVHASDAAVRWVETGLGTVEDVGRLVERMLGLAIERTLETIPAAGAMNSAAQLQSPLPAAQRTALNQARLLLLQRTIAETDAAIASAETVAHAHPDAADAWAVLAAAHYSRQSFRDQDSGVLVAAARAAADRALTLDPDQPMALRTKAILLGKCDYDAAGAENLFRHALRAMPNYTSARLNYAELLTLAGRFDDALVELNLARVFDPLSASVHLARAICLAYQRRHEEARAEWALCRAAGDASLWTLTGAGLNELGAGAFDAGAALLDEAAARFPGMPAAILCRAWAHATRGDAAQARAVERECLARHPGFSPAWRALLAALLRDRQATLQLLVAALAEHDIALLAVTLHPALDWLTDDVELAQLRSRCPIWQGRRRS